MAKKNNLCNDAICVTGPAKINHASAKYSQNNFFVLLHHNLITIYTNRTTCLPLATAEFNELSSAIYRYGIL